MILSLHSSFAQSDFNTFQKLFSTAVYNVNYKQYESSLRTFLFLDSVSLDSLFSDGDNNSPNYRAAKEIKILLKYHIAECYMNMRGQKTLAIPYLSEYINLQANPSSVLYLKLGELYHLNFEFENAINYFQVAKRMAQVEKNSLRPIQDQLKIKNLELIIKRCIEYENMSRNGLKNTAYPEQDTFNVENVGITINNGDTQTSSFISANDSVMIYNNISYYNTTDGQLDSTITFKFTTRKFGNWNKPTELIFDDPWVNTNINLSGMSADGKTAYFCITTNGRSDLYYSTINGNTCSSLIRFPPPINSKYDENYIWISPRGDEAIFSSNRPNGLGGYDLYFCRIENEVWNEAINLGIPINSNMDEDNPCYSPIDKRLYFSSNGHTTMGGYDLFYSSFSNGWTLPIALPYPLNTTDDNRFVSVDSTGKVGYFTSSLIDNRTNQDIYKFNNHENIKHTLLKTVVTDENNKKINAKLRLINTKDGSEVTLKYNKNTNDGIYYFIVSPAQIYELIVESAGYVPRKLMIRPPRQTYYFPLYQQITLSQKSVLSQIQIENINIRNVFFDVTDAQSRDNRLVLQYITELATSPNFYPGHWQKIVKEYPNDSLFYKENTYGLSEAVSRAIENMDTAMFSGFKQTMVLDEKYEKKYYYEKGQQSSGLNLTVFNNDTMWIAPTFKAFPENKLNVLSMRLYRKNNKSNSANMNFPDTTNRRQLFSHTLYYKFDVVTNKTKPNDPLEEIANFLMDNDEIQLQLNCFMNQMERGYEDRFISKKRGEEILNYLKNKNVDVSNAIVNYFRESKTPDTEDRQEFRKVEILLYINQSTHIK